MNGGTPRVLGRGVATLARIVTVVVSLTASAEGGKKVALITLRSTTFEIGGGSGPQDTVDIPVQATKGIDLRRSDVRTIDAAWETMHSEALMKAFGGVLEMSNSGSHLRVTIDSKAIERPGKYTVVLSLDSKRAGLEPQEITLEFQHPNATLRVFPETLVVESVQTLPGDLIPDRGLNVALEETGGRSRSSVNPEVNTNDVMNDGHPVEARLKLAAIELAPAERKVVSLSSEGQFPPGVTTGSIELRASQVEKPVILKYELRTRVRSRTVIVALLVGLVLGWLAKKGLRKVAEVSRLRREIMLVEKEARDRFARAHDSAFRGEIENLINRCESARKSRSETSLTNSGKDLRVALEKASATLASGRADAAAKLHAFGDAVETQWALPKELVKIVKDLRTKLADASKMLKEDDVGGAIAAINEAFTSAEPPSPSGLAVGLASETGAWRTTMLELAAALSASATAVSWPEASGAIVAETATQINDLVKALPTLAASDSKALGERLQCVHDLQQTMLDGAARLRTTQTMVMKANGAVLAELAIDPRQIQAIVNLSILPDSDPAACFTAAIDHATDLADKFRAALTSVLADNTTALEKVLVLVAEGKWRAAAILAQAESRAEGNIRGPGAMPSVAELSAPNLRTVAAPRGGVFVPPAPTSKHDLDRAIANSTTIEWLAAILTSGFSGALLLVVYFLHFSRIPIATVPDLVGVAAQAFALDLSLDALVQGGLKLVKG